MYHKALILICGVAVVYGLTCDEILELPSDKKMSLQELQTIQPPQNMVQCLAQLGKEQMGVEEAAFIWRTIVSVYEDVANVPDSVLMLLHWVTPALTPADYQNISFTNIDVIQNFGLNYQLSDVQLSALADRVRDDFAGKEPEDYTYYDLVALRQILCAFNRSEIERIHPSSYREAVVVIGSLEDCSPEVMLGFATLAVQRKAFGPPATWSESTIKLLGKVADYMPKGILTNLKPKPDIPIPDMDTNIAINKLESTLS